MFNFYFSAKILAIKDIRIKKPGFFVFIFNKLGPFIQSIEGRQKGKSKVYLQNASRLIAILPARYFLCCFWPK